MNIRELSAELDRLIPKTLSCPWDNDGLLCSPNPERQVGRVLLALDITPDIADFAVEGGYDAVISHHPLIFKPLKQLDCQGSEATALKLYSAGISALSYHTRLDAVSGGVADCLADLIGIKNMITVPSTDGMMRLGEVDEITICDFADRIKASLNAPAVLYSSAGKPVRRVAVSPGDGKDFVLSAVESGADTFVTGRLSYNIMCDAPKYGINLIEAGHYYTEKCVLGHLASLVLELTGAETNIRESLNINIR